MKNHTLKPHITRHELNPLIVKSIFGQVCVTIKRSQCYILIPVLQAAERRVDDLPVQFECLDGRYADDQLQQRRDRAAPHRRDAAPYGCFSLHLLVSTNHIGHS